MGGSKMAPSLASYWTPPTEYYGQPVYGGTLRINYEDPLEHANVWGAAGDGGGADRQRKITMSNLLRLSPYHTSSVWIPDLAYGWTVHDDAKGVTFDLREGVKWHNGADFTCEDARFTFETIITSNNLTTSYLGGLFDNVVENSPQCLDDLTLEFRFNAATALPLQTINDDDALIFNKEWFLEGGEDAMFQDLSLGTGPYIWDEGQSVGRNEQRFHKNPDYYMEGVPYVDELVLFGILDESAQQAAMLSHQTDWHWVRNWGQYEAYVNHDQIVTVIGATRGAFAAFMNPRRAPFDNVKVRQALFMAIDRDAGIQVLQQGRASSGFMFPPGSGWTLDQEVGCAVPGWCQPEDMEAQRAEAHDILEGEGFDFTKTYTLTVESDAQVVERAVFLQEQLRLLGVSIDFDTVESVAYRDQQANGTWGDFMAANSGAGSFDDPSQALGLYLKCASSRSYYFFPDRECDQTFEGLLGQMDSALDPVERRKISDEAQLYAMQNYWKLPLYWEQEAQAFWPEARGYVYQMSASGHWREFSHMWIDPSHKDDREFKGQTTGAPGGIQ
jgi:peptide/nickel transport system substrate-binding protein